MATPYEVEHNIKADPASSGRRRRQIDMSTFTAHLHSLQPQADEDEHHDAAGHNARAPPTPADTAAVFRLVRDQMATLAQTAPTADNRDLLRQLVELLSHDMTEPPEQLDGVPQTYLDALDRVPKRRLRADDTCPICADAFLDDPYPLVVQLPCHGAHRFDLECVGPWLLSKGTCPLCRKDLMEKERRRRREREEAEAKRREGAAGERMAGHAEEEEDDPDMLYL